MAGSGGIGDGDRPTRLEECAGDGALDPLNDERRDCGRSGGGNIATDGVLIMDMVGVGGAGGMIMLDEVVAWRGTLGTLGVAAVLDALIDVEATLDARYAASWSFFSSLALVTSDSASLADAEPRRT